METRNAGSWLGILMVVSAGIVGGTTLALAQSDLTGFYAGVVAGTGFGSLTANADEIDHRPSGGFFGGKPGSTSFVRSSF